MSEDTIMLTLQLLLAGCLVGYIALAIVAVRTILGD